MATKKVGELIKEARTNKGLSQTALAEMIDGLSGTDIGKAERGEKSLTDAQLKAIAKATGVTQKSLLEAPKPKTATSSKTTTAKTTPKTTTKTTSSKTTAKTSGAKTTTKTTTAKELTLTATEKNLVELYRKADSDTKKAAISLLKGEKTQVENVLSSLLEGKSGAGEILSSVIENAIGSIGKKK